MEKGAITIRLGQKTKSSFYSFPTPQKWVYTYFAVCSNMQKLFCFTMDPKPETVTTLGLFCSGNLRDYFRRVTILYHRAPDTDIFAAALSLNTTATSKYSDALFPATPIRLRKARQLSSVDYFPHVVYFNNERLIELNFICIRKRTSNTIVRVRIVTCSIPKHIFHKMDGYIWMTMYLIWYL